MTRSRLLPYARAVGTAAWNAKLWLKRATLVVTCVLFTVIILVEIAFRYFLFLPLHGIEELATYLAIWTYFIGGAYGAYERSHISASLIEMLVTNPRVSKLVRVVANAITVAVAAWMTVWTFEYLAWSVRLGPRSLELRAPLYWVHAAMFVGMALMTFYFAIELLDNLGVLRRDRAVRADGEH
jgi:TRAP-type C4-dicarboxylate transport system permease small subunit